MSFKILVVDDEADVRAFLTAVLNKEVTRPDSGGWPGGLRGPEREKPDLVILDLQMPNQTGTDFYRRLTKDKDLRNIPVIVVSGLAGRHLAVKEPVAVFDKPIDPEEFGDTVDRALGVDLRSSSDTRAFGGARNPPAGTEDGRSTRKGEKMSVTREKDHTHANPGFGSRRWTKVSDPDELVEIACTDDSPRVRLTAVSRLNDDDSLERVARTPNRWTSVWWRSRGSSRKAWWRTSQGAREPRAHRHVFLAHHRPADHRVHREDSRVQVGRCGGWRSSTSPTGLPRGGFRSRGRRAEERKSRKRCTRSSRPTAEDPRRAGDRQVPAQREGAAGPRNHRPQGWRNRRAGGGVPVLGTRQRQPGWRNAPRRSSTMLTDPDLVDCIIRALDNPDLREPVRKVLRQIDTPEARAALGEQSARN